MENEIKLAFSSVDVLMKIVDAQWFISLIDDDTHHEPVKLTNIYFDTSDRQLKNRGTSVRVRLCEGSEGSCYVHTVKYGGQVVNGLHQRYEWNVDSQSSTFDVDDFINAVTDKDDPKNILIEALEGINSKDLIPLCSTYCERTTYIAKVNCSTMEVCLDTGFIKGGDLTEDICELEIELIKGNVEDIEHLAKIITDNTGSHLFDDSKYIRAIRLLDKSNGK
jgi:Uncharacterized conserved protein